jgi:oligopeptide transport system ATP-binding protein
MNPINTPSISKNSPLLKVENLRKTFILKKDWLGRPTQMLKALDGVSFELNAGETLGVVGESGSGKSTLGKCLVRLLDPDSGTIQMHGKEISKLSGEDLLAFRKKVQMVFQDPFSSLNPRKNIMSILAEPFLIHESNLSRDEIRSRSAKLLSEVGLKPEHLDRFPHQFSGGQRQRIGIARALALKPELIICDEPVSALDVSIQAQVINLLIDLQKSYQLSLIFIAHDLRVVRHISDRVAIMTNGQIVELRPSSELFSSPKHAYTQKLLAAIPQIPT